MITFRAYNVIIPKFRIEDLVQGGLKWVERAFGHLDYQEDEYLVAVGVANATEVREVFEKLLKMGITYNDKTESSDNFVVLAKEGIWWPAPWLVYNDVGCWFIADVAVPAQLTNK